MEAISTSVPSINNLRKLHSKQPHSFHHHHHHLKPSLHLHHLTPSTSISTRPSSPSHPLHTPLHPPPQPQHRPSTHRNAATGYAAALVDAALSNASLHAVHNDVRRLLRWLRGNEALRGVMEGVEEGVKGRVVREVVVKGGFEKVVVKMVKMLVGKGKVGLVVQVLEEFERVYWELNGGLRVVA